jgi:RNA polymerase sigma factor (sigma-70 family)
MTDLQLLEQYAESRDAEAFADLVKRYAGMVYAVCLRVTGNAHAAEDASQECFLQLARQAGAVRSSLAGWLHKTATTRALMIQRGDAARRNRERKAVEMNGAAKPGDETTWAEIAPYVDEALAELPDELRDPLARHFLQGKTQAEVAEELGVDRSSVSRRMNKGLERLRTVLKRRGVIVTSAALGTLLLSSSAQAAPVALTAALGKMAMAGITAGKTVAAATPLLGGVSMVKLGIVTVVGIAAIVTAANLSPAETKEQPDAPRATQAETGQEQTAAETRTTELPADTVVYAGIVTDEAGVAIEGATVRSDIVNFRTGEYRQSEAMTITDVEGRFGLPPLRVLSPRQDSRKLIVMHPDYAIGGFEQLWNVDPGNLHVKLAMSQVVSGRVTDEADEPVEGAIVSARIQKFGEQELSFGTHNGFAATTDADGRFVLDKVPADWRLHVSVTHPEFIGYDTSVGYRSFTYPIKAGTMDVEVRLSPGARIEGRLTHDGKPMELAGVIVQAKCENGGGRARTDEGGRFRMSGLRDGTYTVFIDPSSLNGKDYACLPQKGVQAKAGETPRVVVFDLREGVPVEGRLLREETGEPLLDEPISACWDDDIVVGWSRTNQDGVYTLELLPGEYTLRKIGFWNGEYVTVTEDIVVEEGKPLRVKDLQVPVKRMVRGRLVDKVGKSVKGQVFWMGRAEDTSDKGEFSLPEPFRAPTGEDEASILLAFDEKTETGVAMLWRSWDIIRDLEIVMVPTAMVSGRLIDPQGGTLTDVVTRLSVPSEGSDPIRGPFPSWPWKADVKPDGRFSVSRVPTGFPLELYVDTPGSYARLTLDNLGPGENRDVGDVVLRSKASHTDGFSEGPPANWNASVAGIVVDSTGKPVAGAVVECESQSRPGRDTTDLNGRFHLVNLPANRKVTIRAFRPGQDYVAFEGIESGTEDLRLELPVKDVK